MRFSRNAHFWALRKDNSSYICLIDLKFSGLFFLNEFSWISRQFLNILYFKKVIHRKLPKYFCSSFKGHCDSHFNNAKNSSAYPRSYCLFFHLTPKKLKSMQYVRRYFFSSNHRYFTACGKQIDLFSNYKSIKNKINIFFNFSGS